MPGYTVRSNVRRLKKRGPANEGVPWVKWKGRTRLVTFCERCEDSFTAHLPMRLECFAGLVQVFIKTHRKCERRPTKEAK